MPQQPKVYLTRAGGNGEDEDYCLEHGLAMIGFREFPSLAGADDYNAVLKLVTAADPELKPRAAPNLAGQLSAFAISIREGDIVVLPRKLTSQVALGKVKGPYEYKKIGNEFRHVRSVEWIRTDDPRTTFGQDLLNSFGAFMTVCRISRNDAERRVAAVIQGNPDPGSQDGQKINTNQLEDVSDSEGIAISDFSQIAHDQIVSHIQIRFAGHAMARLVDAVLRVDGWVSKLSPPGPDGGVDIVAGRGSLGLDAPRLCVQVKSQATPCDVTVYRTLQGSMQTFGATQGLLVCWGGFTRAVHSEAKQGYFSVRLWESRDLVEAIYRNYEDLPAEVQAELPLKKVWMLVKEDSNE